MAYYHFRVEATGALAHRSHASTPFDKLSPYSSRFLMQTAVIPKSSKNYREISEKRRPVYAYNSFRITSRPSCNQSWFAIRQRPFDLRIRVAAIAFSRKIL